MTYKWTPPNIVINGKHIHYDYVKNHINIGTKDCSNIELISAPTASPEEMYTSCLIHETVHWAQTQELSYDENAKVGKAYRRQGYEDALIEKHAVDVEDEYLRGINKLRTAQRSILRKISKLIRG